MRQEGYSQFQPAIKRLLSRVSWTNIFGLLILPGCALSLIPWLVSVHGAPRAEIGGMVLLWCLTGGSITAGYHRLYAHKSWEAPKLVRFLLLVFGAGALQNSAICWVADHRKHHQHTDLDGDPYNSKRGFWYAHIGWALLKSEPVSLTRVPDLWRDPLCRWQHRNYLLLAIVFNILAPLILGLLSGRIAGMLLFAGLLRIIMVHQFTFLINSACHLWGRQPWETRTSARDNWWVALVTFGEGYHNYHHAYPSDYRNGIQWYHFDPTKWVIWTLARLGFARHLCVVNRHRLLAATMGPAPVTSDLPDLAAEDLSASTVPKEAKTTVGAAKL